MFPPFSTYYHSFFSGSLKAAYEQIYYGVQKQEKSIFLKDIYYSEQVQSVLWAVYNDFPNFFYLDPSAFTIYPSKNCGVICELNYLYSEEKIKKYNEMLKNGLKNFQLKVMGDEKDDFKKILKIHDYLVKKVSYDNDADIMKTYDNPEAYNILGSLFKKKAVCWSISLAFKFLCDYFRIKALVVVGSSSKEWNEDNHAWNIVQIDNLNYHIDVTWDIKEKDNIDFCYEYFNLTDKLIKLDHSWSTYSYPICNSNIHNYYFFYKLYVKDISEISYFIEQQILKNKREIAFKYANTNIDKNDIEYEIHKTFKRLHYSYIYSINAKTYNIYIQITN